MPLFTLEDLRKEMEVSSFPAHCISVYMIFSVEYKKIYVTFVYWIYYIEHEYITKAHRNFREIKLVQYQQTFYSIQIDLHIVFVQIY